jgi:hypothetical protein
MKAPQNEAWFAEHDFPFLYCVGPSRGTDLRCQKKQQIIPCMEGALPKAVCWAEHSIATDHVSTMPVGMQFLDHYMCAPVLSGPNTLQRGYRVLWGRGAHLNI